MTPQYKLDRLLAERSKWQRRATIAQNKLAKAQRALDRFTQEITSKEITRNENQN